MTDDAFRGLIHGLSMYARRKTVTSLLQGNDTQCFTTEQYEQAYCKINWKGMEENGLRMFRNYDVNLSRRHLESLNLKEIKPNLWTCEHPEEVIA